MLDFYKIITEKQSNKIFVRPEFIVGKKSSDLMIRGKDFYAVWDEESKLWVTNENYVINKIDEDIRKCMEKYENVETVSSVIPLYMENASSGSIDRWHKYVQKQLRDNYKELDSKIIFSNTIVEKNDYVSKKLPYPLEPGNVDSYEELMSTLYKPEERDKLEWAVGAIISGDSKKIQKFIVLHGDPGSGKSTFLNIVQKLFEGYYNSFDAKALTNGGSFALDSFKSNPLVSIQHDGDLSRIEDNTKLNSIVSHELMEINVKYGGMYEHKFQTFLFMGTNKLVKITDGKSGLLRRLIDVYPTGKRIPVRRYEQLIRQIDFELGAIAYHCLKKYEEMGFNYYDSYIPRGMMEATNDFYDFVEYYYDEFAGKDYIQLKTAWNLYKTYCELANTPYPMSMRAMRLEFKNYFDEYIEDTFLEGVHYRNIYKGFKTDIFTKKFTPTKKSKEETWLKFEYSSQSIFDIACADCPAQLAGQNEKPTTKWAEVETKLSNIDTTKLHYVKVPKYHIVIDFDLKDENSNKSLEKNIEAASKWPKTYAELSKSGAGIHLHYIYDGNPDDLSYVYDEGIEVKVFVGKSSLRRKLTKCNNIQIAHINSGLPLKEDKAVVDFTTIKNEKALRTIISKNLKKEYHSATKPSVDFIYKALEDAYRSGMKYDVSDMRQAVVYFASQSTNQADYCLELVTKMKFKSEDEEIVSEEIDYDNAPIVFYDVEIFPNLCLINWKFSGEDNKVVRMINPTPGEVEELTHYRLIGFNCRRYDNHILYAIMMGYNNLQLYHLSQRLIDPNKPTSNAAMFANAYNLSYADIYDFMSTKQSLKKWEIELGIHHQELGLPWDEPVPEEKWEQVAEYCDNDVIATETLFYSEQGQADFTAREIIAAISGLPINTTTNSHSMQIIFEGNKKPQTEFVYTDLSTIFPGYKFDFGEIEEEVKGKVVKRRIKKSSYRDVDEVGEGGYVYSEPGMYENVWTFDVSSMHPNSIKALNLFGDYYTKRFYDLVEIRLAIKHGDFEKASEMFNGKLKPYLKDKTKAKQLSTALKIVINSVYGLTSASFDNPFRDPRNVDNIVAKRGALFMIDLKYELEDKGIQVIHVKTDSIKVSNPSERTKKFIMDFGKKYGYTFEIENVYSKFCLVNDAVYIAKYAEPKIDENSGKEIWWTATGAQFAQPYVFKTLFSKEPITFDDMCETKAVKTAIYLDMNENLEVDEHNYIFVGKVGLFCPILPGHNAGILVAERDDPKTGGKKYSAVTATKGYRWLESEVVRGTELEQYIDKSYYIKLVDAAIADIGKYGDFEMFVG